MEKLTVKELADLYEGLLINEARVKEIIEKDDNGEDISDEETLFLADYATDSLKVLLGINLLDNNEICNFEERRSCGRDYE
jgi:hypothetical protein